MVNVRKVASDQWLVYFLHAEDADDMDFRRSYLHYLRASTIKFYSIPILRSINTDHSYLCTCFVKLHVVEVLQPPDAFLVELLRIPIDLGSPCCFVMVGVQAQRIGCVRLFAGYGVRFGIEEVFKDLKAVWGWGKQELRLLESNEAATVMNMVLITTQQVGQ